MLSVNNDAKTIATAGVSAAAASAVTQNAGVRRATRKVATTIADVGKKAVNKDTFKKAGEMLNNAGKATFKGETYKQFAKNISDTAKKCVNKDSYKKVFENAAKVAKNFKTSAKGFINKLGLGVKNFITKTNWSKAAKVGVVATAIATGIVLLSNMMNKDKNNI